LLSAISHDFRTPLATIIGAGSTLRDSAPGTLEPAQRATLLDTLLHEAERMNRLMGNLLDLTRLTGERTELRRDGIAIDELVGGVLERLRAVLARHPVSLAIPDDPPLVWADEVLLGQVLSNLLENAARHTPAGTAIEISAQVSQGTLQVGVRDHGPGFAPGDEQRVFDKFHQGAPESAQSGFGLGLAISKAIVDAHGGTISARNAPGGGAEISFTVPTQAPRPTPA